MPKLGTREECIRVGCLIAECGIELLTVKAVSERMHLTYRAIIHHFPGGDVTLRAAVLERAARLRNPFILGQLRARRSGGPVP